MKVIQELVPKLSKFVYKHTPINKNRDLIRKHLVYMIEWTNKYALDAIAKIKEKPLTHKEKDKLLKIYKITFARHTFNEKGLVFTLNEHEIIEKTEKFVTFMHGRFLIGRENRKKEQKRKEQKKLPSDLLQFVFRKSKSS